MGFTGFVVALVFLIFWWGEGSKKNERVLRAVKGNHIVIHGIRQVYSRDSCVYAVFCGLFKNKREYFVL